MIAAHARRKIDCGLGRTGESSRVNLPPPPNRYSSPAAQDVLSATRAPIRLLVRPATHALTIASVAEGLDVTLVPIGPISLSTVPFCLETRRD